MSEHNHNHGHEHEHHHNDDIAHIHSHRNLIGFDEHGIPTVTLKASHHGGEEDDDPQAFIKDYMNAVSEYRKTFPSKQDVIDQTPDPAVREMLLRMEQLGIDTAFDRFDQQKPQCNFGLAGICCKICNAIFSSKIFYYYSTFSITKFNMIKIYITSCFILIYLFF